MCMCVCGGGGGKLPPLGATEREIPPIVRARILLARNLVFSRRKLALTLLCRTRYILLYI